MIATIGAAYYFNEANNYSRLYDDAKSLLQSSKINVNLLIRYPDGTMTWHNNTQAQLGDSLFDFTSDVLKVDYTEFPFGAYVKGINNVQEQPERNRFWLWWYWTGSDFGWVQGPVGADAFKLREGSIVAWYLQDASQIPPEPPS